MATQTTISPHNQQPLVIKTYPSESELANVISQAEAGQKEWAKVPLRERIAIGRKFMVSNSTLSAYR